MGAEVVLYVLLGIAAIILAFAYAKFMETADEVSISTDYLLLSAKRA